MTGLKLIWDYIFWHYSVAIMNIFLIWWDFEWFLWNYFSISRLARTFFVPWRRLGENTMERFNLVAVATAITVTTIMRIVGILFRSITIITGLLLMVLLIPASAVALAVWLAMPVILLFIFALGLELIVKRF